MLNHSPDADSRQDLSHTNSVTEFDPYTLRSDLTDRELLAIFVTTLTDPMTAFIEDIERAVDAVFRTDEHPHLRAQLHVLREALRLAAQRTADAGSGREGVGDG